MSSDESASDLRLRADTLGLLRRAGVEAEAASRIAGIAGATFIPGEPITIRNE